MQRQLATYFAYGDNGAITEGGQTTLSPAKLLFEIQAFVNGVAGIDAQLRRLP